MTTACLLLSSLGTRLSKNRKEGSGKWGMGYPQQNGLSLHFVVGKVGVPYLHGHSLLTDGDSLLAKSIDLKLHLFMEYSKLLWAKLNQNIHCSLGRKKLGLKLHGQGWIVCEQAGHTAQVCVIVCMTKTW